MRKGSFPWSLFILYVLSLALTGCLAAIIAESHRQSAALVLTDRLKHLHASGFEQWQAIRILPVEVLSVEDDTIYWKYEDAREVRLGSFVFDTVTQLPKDFLQQPKGRYLVLYCDPHKVAYEVIPLK